MRERRIGRPSHAIILPKLPERKDVVRKNGRLIPARTGRLVFDYLDKHYGNVVSEEVTRELEEKMGGSSEGLTTRRF